MSKKYSVLSVLLAASILFVVIFSAFYIASEIDHDCCGEDCPICCQVELYENAVKTISQIVITCLCTVFFRFIVFVYTYFFEKRAFHKSLVTLKVKLSN